MAKDKLEIIISADDQASGKLDNVSKSAGGLGKAIGTGLKAAALVGTAALAGIGAGAMVAIKQAGDASEMMSKFNVVFGRSAEDTAGFLEAMAAEVGRSKYELMGMASQLQDTFVPMGFARGEAAGLARQMTRLAVDVGSFNNVADEDVMRDFQSAIVGNHETVRKYGIVITQAALEQELFNMGLEGGLENATEQEKVMARLNLIIGGTSDAQGDAARTADSWANMMRSISSVIKDTTTDIGLGLLPVLSPMVAQFRDIAQVWGPKVTTFLTTQAIPAMTGFASSIADGVSGAFNDLSAAFQSGGLAGVFALLAQDIADAWPGIRDALAGWGVQFWEWLTGPGGAIDYVGAQLAIVGSFITTNAPVLWASIQGWATEFWGWLTGPGGAIDYVGSELNRIGGVIAANWPQISAQLTEWGTKFWDWLTGEGGALTQATTQTFQVAWAIGDALESEESKQVMRQAGYSLGEEIGKGIVEAVTAIFSPEGAATAGTATAIAAGFWSAGQRVRDGLGMLSVEFAASFVQGFVAAIPGLSPQLAQAITDGFKNSFEMMIALVSLNIPGYIGRIYDGITGAWGGVDFSKLGSMMIDAVGAGIDGAAGGLIDKFVGAVSAAWNAAVGFLTGVGGSLMTPTVPGGVAGANGGAATPPGYTGMFQNKDDGGVVAGPIGSPQLVMAHGGETFIPTHKTDGGIMNNITMVLDGEVVGRYMGRQTSRLQRMGGMARL